MAVLNGTDYTLALLTGSNGYGYTTLGTSGSPLFPDQLFADLLVVLASAATAQGGVSPGTAGAVLYSNGSAWVRSASPSLTSLTISSGTLAGQAITGTTLVLSTSAAITAAAATVGLTVTQAANANAVSIIGVSTTDQSFGMLVTAGTSANDRAALFRNQSGSSILLLRGDRTSIFGGPVHFAAGTTGDASFNVPSGTAPTSPNDGDLWWDGANLKFRAGVSTKSITLT